MAREAETLVTWLYLLADNHVYREFLYVVYANRTYQIELDSLHAHLLNQHKLYYTILHLVIHWISENWDIEIWIHFFSWDTLNYRNKNYP